MPWITFPRVRVRVSAFCLSAALFMLALESAVPFAVLMLSALWHELGHLFALKKCGARPRRIDLLPMGALIVCPEGLSYGEELRVALAGPLFSFAAALAGCAAYLLCGGVYPLFACIINSLLALFNLMPAIKLDGGKALYFLLCAKGADRRKTARVCFAANVCALFVCGTLAVSAWIASGFNAGVIVLFLSLALQTV